MSELGSHFRSERLKRSLTLEELMSIPSKGGDWRLNKDPIELKIGPL